MHGRISRCLRLLVARSCSSFGISFSIVRKTYIWIWSRYWSQRICPVTYAERFQGLFQLDEWAGVELWTGHNDSVAQCRFEKRHVVSVQSFWWDGGVKRRLWSLNPLLFWWMVAIAGIPSRCCWRKAAIFKETYTHVSLNCRQNGAAISQADTIKLSKVANTCTAIFKRGTTFVDVGNVMLNYAGAFLPQQAIYRMNARMKDVFEDRISPGLLLTRSRTTFIRYVWFTKSLLSKMEWLLLLDRLSKEQIRGRPFRTSHLDNDVQYGSIEGIWIAEAATLHFKNPMKTHAYHIT